MCLAWGLGFRVKGYHEQRFQDEDVNLEISGLALRDQDSRLHLKNLRIQALTSRI